MGTDDGTVQMTRDGGATWTDLTDRVRDLPERTYVSKLLASRHDEATVYATFDGHRNDDFGAYVYVSEDYGRRWHAITDGLADGWTVNGVTEHPRNPNLLFAATETGVYFSIDRGERWNRLKNNLPTVPVDDIVVHPRENDLVLGTHGRGVWIMDDITPLEEMTVQIMASSAHLFSVRPTKIFTENTPQGWTPGVYAAPNPPSGALIRYYLQEDLRPADQVVSTNGGPNAGTERATRASTKATITILDSRGETVRSLEGPGEAGIQEVNWDLRIEPPYEADSSQAQDGFGGGRGRRFRRTPRGPRVLPGTYTVRLETAGQTLTTDLEVRGDPRIEISRADLAARQEAMMNAYRLAEPNYEAGQAARRLGRQLTDVARLLDESGDAPESLTERVDSLQGELRELQEQLQRTGAGAGAAFAIEATTSRPTADQLWQLEQSWEQLPGLIEQLNMMISSKMPALYDQLNEHGIRPDPGKALTVPTRR